MTWVSVSLRKMELKNRINTLESQLIDISQRMQTIADEKASEQTKQALQSNFELSQVRTKYLKDMTSVFTADDKAATIQDSLLSQCYNDEGQLDIAKFQEMFGLDGTAVEGLTEETMADDLFTRFFTGQDGVELLKNLDETSTKYLANMHVTSNYLDEKMSLTALNQAEADALRSEADSETQALEAQQEQIQTQLKAARAEYDNLGEALDKDIQTSTIKLV